MFEGLLCYLLHTFDIWHFFFIFVDLICNSNNCDYVQYTTELYSHVFLKNILVITRLSVILTQACTVFFISIFPNLESLIKFPNMILNYYFLILSGASELCLTLVSIILNLDINDFKAFWVFFEKNCGI